jgi:hypothetical protein
MLTQVGLVAAVLCLSLGLAREAAAYPQFQFTSGTTRCSQCHFSPAGTGLITGWGRDESGDTISLGGDGSFLHGAVELPSWLALGLDFRYVALFNDVGGPESPETVLFPMQGDAYARVAFSESVSLNVTFGARGVVRPESSTLSDRLADVPSRSISREHYLMWKPGGTGPYVRAGRFFAPYGLRLAEHPTYVRRYTGFNLYEETYNLSGGVVAEGWELHATAFMPVPAGFPDVLQAVGHRGSGGTVYAEKRLENIALGAQTRIAVGDDESRYQGGGIGKIYFEGAKLLLMGEADFIRRAFPGYGQNELVGYLNATFFPMKGLMTGLALEHYQENLSVAKTARRAFNLQINFFPWAHFEIVLLGRYQMTGSGSADGAPASLGMLQLHYYL